MVTKFRQLALETSYHSYLSMDLPRKTHVIEIQELPFIPVGRLPMSEADTLLFYSPLLFQINLI